eukprot:4762882-Alexandrium_andersonii.AAC.1
MSASLVGSEMCIRDRVRGRGPILPDVLEERRIAHQRLGHIDPVLGHEPVSYTHLTLPTICSV